MPDQQREHGSVVVLRDSEERIYTTLLDAPVASYDAIQLGAMISVVRPIGIATAEPYQVGAVFDLLLTQPSGLLVVPVELAGIRNEQKLRMWDFRVAAQPWREQRREFVRVGVFGRVTVHSDLLDADPSPINGYLVDLSEAAMQTSLWSSSSDLRLAEGAPVTVEFYAGRTSFTIEGIVLTTRPNTLSNETWAVIQFDQSPQQADILRREVFAVQVQMRRAWREIQETEELGTSS